MSPEVYVAILAIVLGGVGAYLLGRWLDGRRFKREVARVTKMLPGGYLVQHNLCELEPLVSLYDAASGALLPMPDIKPLDEMSLEIWTDYERPFRAVVVNARTEHYRRMFIPHEEARR